MVSRPLWRKGEGHFEKFPQAKGIGKGMGQQDRTQEIVVVNASVFLAVILLDEPLEIGLPAGALVADILSGKICAHVPDRFEDEVLGGLVEALTKGRPVAAQPLLALQELLTKMTVHRRGVDWEASEVFAAALRWRVSYYDALYLVIAQRVGGTYWTADKKLLRYLQRQKFSDLPQVGWIGNFKSPQT